MVLVFICMLVWVKSSFFSHFSHLITSQFCFCVSRKDNSIKIQQLSKVYFSGVWKSSFHFTNFWAYKWLVIWKSESLITFKLFAKLQYSHAKITIFGIGLFGLLFSRNMYLFVVPYLCHHFKTLSNHYTTNFGGKYFKWFCRENGDTKKS